MCQKVSMPTNSVPEPVPEPPCDDADGVARAELVKRLFREHNQTLLSLLTLQLKSVQDAKQVAQESYVRLLQLDRPGAASLLRAYLFRIASNLAITELRKRKRRSVLSLTGLFQSDEAEVVEFLPPDLGPLVDIDLVEDERSRVIAKAIATLPPKYRIPIILRDVEGRSYEDVAELMQLGLGTTKSRISRGRGLLKEKLIGYMDRPNG